MFLLPRGNASGGPGTLCGSPHTCLLTYVSHGYVMMVNDTRKALAETKRSGRRLAAEYAVTRILAESATIKDAVNGVLRVVGENLDWELGMFWEMEKQNQRLRFVDLGTRRTWRPPSSSRTAKIGRLHAVKARRPCLGHREIVVDSGRLCRSFVPPRGHGGQGHVAPCISRQQGRAVIRRHRLLHAHEAELTGMSSKCWRISIKVGLFVDRKRTEQELRDTEARLVQEHRLAEVARVLGDIIGHDSKFAHAHHGRRWSCSKRNCANALPNCRRLQLRPPNPRERTHELTEMIKQNSRRIHDRVKEIADSVKGLTRPPQFGPCRLSNVVSGVYHTSASWPTKGRWSCARKDSTLPVIRADESRLFNAIYNLVNNAIPEVPSGGSVTIRGRLDESASTWCCR